MAKLIEWCDTMDNNPNNNVEVESLNVEEVVTTVPQPVEQNVSEQSVVAEQSVAVPQPVVQEVV